MLCHLQSELKMTYKFIKRPPVFIHFVEEFENKIGSSKAENIIKQLAEQYLFCKETCPFHPIIVKKAFSAMVANHLDHAAWAVT